MSNVIKSEARVPNVSSHHNGSSIICNNVIMDISLRIEVVVSGMYLNSTKTQYNYMTLYTGIPSQYSFFSCQFIISHITLVGTTGEWTLLYYYYFIVFVV